MKQPICYLTIQTDNEPRELLAPFTWDETFAVWAQVERESFGPLFVLEKHVIAARPAHH